MTELPQHSEEILNPQSDFLSNQTPEKKSVRLSSALLNYTRPDGINPVPLGSSWALDLLARLHNATRRELIDLYNMVDSMKRRVQQLGSADLRTFFTWWYLFSSFLKTTFEAHTQLLFPWVSSKAQLPDALDEQAIRGVKDKLQSLFKEFRTANEQLSRRAPDETLARIIKALVHMHLVVQHMENVENTLSDLIEQQFQPAEANRFDKKLARFMHSHGRGDYKRMHLLLIANAMSSEATSVWHKSMPTMLRLSYRTTSKRFNATHANAVRKLAPE
ncbi:hypothetical protein FGB62_1g34 [Gracilaria domingensis]|nr:hypothetical protein FGB62_1g34 [Gracilaria domingensis]